MCHRIADLEILFKLLSIEASLGLHVRLASIDRTLDVDTVTLVLVLHVIICLLAGAAPSAL